MKFDEAISTCMGKYATFSGRASKSEFWWFYLFTFLISWMATISSSVSAFVYDPTGQSVIINQIVVSLIFIPPVLAAGSRRLHDIGKSGWWQLLSLTGIGVIFIVIWWATDTKPEGDRYNEK